MKRRVRCLEVSPEFILIHSKEQAPGRAWRIAQGVPVDAELVETRWDTRRNVLMLFVEHSSFDEVEEGHECPIQDTRYEAFVEETNRPPVKFREFL